MKRAARFCVRELPLRIRDLPADVADVALHSRDGRLPPASLRYHVAGSSDRKSFSAIGRRIADDVLRARTVLASTACAENILDFGVGCGRVSRHVQQWWPHARVTGVDVHAQCIRWCKAHLAGRYDIIDDGGGLPYADASFDFVYAVSVFTHLPLAHQRRWLAELRRVLARDGLLIITTLSPALAHTRPDMTDEQRRELSETGFVYLPGGGGLTKTLPFNREPF